MSSTTGTIFINGGFSNGFSEGFAIGNPFVGPVLTGPPYPPPAGYLSNIIGKFQIGNSPVGTIVPFYYWNTIISQYSNSPIIDQLIGLFDAWIDQTANMEAFYDNIWNINTASGYGLDVWGRIVGVVRQVSIVTSKFFGFDEQTPATVDPFNQSAFYNGVIATNSYFLDDLTYRKLIFAKALANISNGSCASINQILLALFPLRGNCFSTDGHNMTMTYTFNFALSLAEQAIVLNSGVLPRSTGVEAVVIVNGVQIGIES